MNIESHSIWQKEPRPNKLPKYALKEFPMLSLNPETIPFKPCFLEERNLEILNVLTTDNKVQISEPKDLLSESFLLPSQKYLTTNSLDAINS